MQDVDDGQVVTLTNLEIERVVGRSNFQNSCPELRINRFIGDDGNFLTRQRPPCVLAEKIGISFVVWMKSHRCVSHDRFRPCGCDFEKTPRLFHNFVANEVKISFLRLVNDFLI